MGVRAIPLSAAKVKTAPPGRYGDGDGLYLFVRAPEAAFWVFRYTRAGRMREMGLGRARGRNSVALAAARVQASELHRAVRAGHDPLDDRNAAAAARRVEAAAVAVAARTFRQAAEEYIAANGPSWRNPKHRLQWSATLTTYAYPHFGDVPVCELGTANVLAALEPIWQTKPETAARVRGRVELVLSAETARGNRTGENPARWRGHLDHILPARSKVAPVEHHAALPYAELPAFIVKLRAADGLGARALELAILTAARTNEILAATWAEVDLQESVWTVPAARMKGKREHRVPLSDAALAVLQEAARLRTDVDPGALVFPGERAGKPLSNMTLAAVLRRMKRGDITVHGFRSTFRDWVAESTEYQGELAEAALAHVIGDKTEAAYRRGDLFEKRRGMMDAWAKCLN